MSSHLRSPRALLVTGGAGFIGSAFIRRLFRDPAFSGKIVNLDLLTYAGNPENLKGAVKGFPENIKAYFKLVDDFKPDVVVSDFESFSYLYAKNHLLPCISVDNMQVINRCKHAPELLAGHEKEFELTRNIVKAKLPGCFHYLVATFF